MSAESGSWDAWLEAAWRALTADRLDRSLVAIDPVGATQVKIEGREVHLFSGNDYLGLSAHPEVRRAAIDASSTRSSAESPSFARHQNSRRLRNAPAHRRRPRTGAPARRAAPRAPRIARNPGKKSVALAVAAARLWRGQF